MWAETDRRPWFCLYPRGKSWNPSISTEQEWTRRFHTIPGGADAAKPRTSVAWTINDCLYFRLCLWRRSAPCIGMCVVFLCLSMCCYHCGDAEITLFCPFVLLCVRDDSPSCGKHSIIALSGFLPRWWSWFGTIRTRITVLDLCITIYGKY